MEWVKLIAQPAYYLDAALLRAGEPAELLFLRGLAYCGGSDTRGRIDKTVVPMIVASKTQARTAALVREGLWLDEGDHYVVRSWDRWQDEHDRVASVRAGNRERQRRLRDSRARDVTAAVTAPVTPPSRVTSRPVSRDVTALDVDVDVDVDVEEKLATPVVAPRLTAVPAPPVKGTRIPDHWPVTKDRDGLWTWALEHTPAVEIGPETANWQDWHRAKGDTAKDWNASWRTWMRRAQKDAERSPSRTTNRTSAADSAVSQALAVAERFRQAELTSGESA